jgi:hypothetical protein
MHPMDDAFQEWVKVSNIAKSQTCLRYFLMSQILLQKFIGVSIQALWPILEMEQIGCLAG